MSMTLKGKKIAVLGIGEAGRATARYLHGKGAELTCLDRLNVHDWPSGFRRWCLENEIPAVSEDHLADMDISSFDLAVASPGIPPRSPMVSVFRRQNVEVLGELALAAALWNGTLIGITGTNGKTTTTSLTSHILTCSGISNVMAGNISPPFFDVLDKNARTKTAVLEISSFQLEYFPDTWPEWLRRPRFSAAVLLNLAPDHLDRHGSMEEYARCKARLLDFQGQGDLAILGPSLEEITGAIPCTRFCLDLDRNEPWGAFLHDSVLSLSCPGVLKEAYDVTAWKHRGRHNMENLAASITCARMAGASANAVRRALSTFRFPAYRLQESGNFQGITFINDSKATNIAALVAALKALEGDVTLIAGGRGKGEDFGLLSAFLKGENGHGPSAGIKNAVLIGEEAPRLKKALEPFVDTCRTVSGPTGEDTMKMAVELALSLSRPGSTVILSPACASFDMFSDYKARGKAFDKAVRELK